jgi:outer membrane lipoprotein SlyB
LDSSGDVDDAGFGGFAGAEVTGLEGGAWAGSVGAVADPERGGEDLQQEGGQRQVKLVRGGNPP